MVGVHASRAVGRRAGTGAVPAALVGAGLMAAVDEIVFHQLLAWHHFVDRSTPTVGLISDGLLHSAELVALVAGFVGLSRARAAGTLRRAAVLGGLLAGAGSFQLFDGVVDHKVLRLHQVRYGVDLLPYDLAWNAVGAVLLATGALVLMREGARVRARARA